MVNSMGISVNVNAADGTCSGIEARMIGAIIANRYHILLDRRSAKDIANGVLLVAQRMSGSKVEQSLPKATSDEILEELHDFARESFPGLKITVTYVPNAG